MMRDFPLSLIALLVVIGLCFDQFHGFHVPSGISTLTSSEKSSAFLLNTARNKPSRVLEMMASPSGGGKKKRRRRKAAVPKTDAPADSTTPAPADNLEDLRDGTTPDTYSLMDRPLLDTEMATFEAEEAAEGEKKDAGEVQQKKKYSFDLDIELPVESETLAKKGIKKKPMSDTKSKTPLQSADGMMPLPDLKDVSATRKDRKKEEKKIIETQEVKISRKDIEDFKRLLDVEPQLDSTRIETEEEIDMTALLLGVGVKPFFGLERAYLQAGHTVLLAIVLLCAFIDYPGLPLTELPLEIRDFLKTGLLVNYSINTVLAIFSIFKSSELRQPTGFWFGKTLLLGGLSFQELLQIESSKKAKAKRKARSSRGI